MSYERAMYERLICDGCGVAVLEAEDVLSHAPDWGWSVGDKHLCHMCRPDSPFEAVERVRELHRPCSDPHLHDGGRCCLECSDYGRQGVVRMYPCDTLNALEGDSDDPAGT